jgi:Chemoreceptor zinc-binding domain
MDFDQAIAAHSAWKTKLKAYLNNPDHSLKPAEIELDDKCALGQWIHGEGRQFLSNASYSTLKMAHAKFHKAAAAVVRKADSGQSVTEEVTLGATSDFTSASSAVVSAIVAMKRKPH